MGEVEMEEHDIKDGEKDIKKFNRIKKNKNGHKLTHKFRLKCKHPNPFNPDRFSFPHYTTHHSSLSPLSDL